MAEQSVVDSADSALNLMAVGRLILAVTSLAAPKQFAKLVGVKPTPELVCMTRIYGARALAMGLGYLTSGAEERHRWKRLSLAVDTSDTISSIAHLARRDVPLRAALGMTALAGSYAAIGAAKVAATTTACAMPHQNPQPISERRADAQAEIEINADPAVVYALITDLATLASLAEEAHAMQWRRGSSAQPGAVFKGHNRNGKRAWTTTCTVTAAEPGRIFAFDVRSLIEPLAHWRYDIVPTAGGCQVTERMWDHRPGWLQTRMSTRLFTGVDDRHSVNVKNIELTLQRLKTRAERELDH